MCAQRNIYYIYLYIGIKICYLKPHLPLPICIYRMKLYILPLNEGIYFTILPLNIIPVSISQFCPVCLYPFHLITFQVNLYVAIFNIIICGGYVSKMCIKHPSVSLQNTHCMCRLYTHYMNVCNAFKCYQMFQRYLLCGEYLVYIL